MFEINGKKESGEARYARREIIIQRAYIVGQRTKLKKSGGDETGISQERPPKCRQSRVFREYLSASHHYASIEIRTIARARMRARVHVCRDSRLENFSSNVAPAFPILS